MYAILKTGGKQYKVAVGDVLEVEKLDAEIGSTLELTDVLMVQGESGATWGTPNVDGAKVVVTAIEQKRGVKINGITFKPKKNVRRRYGHRQSITTIQIESIVA